jgi:hypothetical protein
MGLPGVVLMYDTLLSVADTTRKRQGTEVRYVAIPFPADTMSPSQERKTIEYILGCLTIPLKPHEQQTGSIEAPKRPRIITRGSFNEINE